MTFFLIIIGISLIVFNTKAILKEKNNTSTSFSATLKTADENMENFNVEIGKLRREISETILSLQMEIQDLKEEKEKDSDIYIKDDIIKGNIIEDENNNSIKMKKVEELLNDNYSIDEIAQKLNVSKGEVLLIKKLYLK